MNKWGIPDWLEKELRERDKFCVYCGVKMPERMPPKGPRKDVATWEHIIRRLMDEITGGTPYGASTLAGTDGSRQPSENELAIARL